jgi:hypothetical protein
MMVPYGVETWTEPVENPIDRDTLAGYDVDQEVLDRWWCAALREYLSARAALLGQIERQGWRAHTTSDYVDIVFDRGPGPWPQRLIEIEDDQGRSVSYGEWMKRTDGAAVLRVPRG